MNETRQYFLNLAEQGHRMPIGTDLILHRQPDPAAIKLSGERLGRVVEEAANHFRTPLAVPLMDLTVEKEWLLSSLGVPAEAIPSYHYSGDVPDAMPDVPPTPRLLANAGAIAHISSNTGLFPCGMSIGPFSFMTKLIADPITPVFLAGMGERDPEVLAVERALELATGVILRSIGAQIDAGAKAVIVCEPAANTTYFSPNQLAESMELFEKYVIALNRRVKDYMEQRGCSLIFHDCGELTADMVRAFATLDPVMVSFGCSRMLWEDAPLLPDDIVLYGNLPTKRFYSDELVSVENVRSMTAELLEKMKAAGHPFILGSECDVLSVPGREDAIMAKVEAFLR